MQVTPDLIRRYGGPAPRYTSYPTANHFSAAIGKHQYVDWLSRLTPEANLSVYLHIPFCEALCFYCACSTKASKRYEPVRRYVRALISEIGSVARLLPQRLPVTHVHWGGGSPSILTPEDIHAISEAMSSAFQVATAAEIAVEIDPRNLSEEKASAFASAGVNRVSLGVQDFDPRVQKAIGREQDFELTRRAIELFREHGVASVNIDLVYGLPFQTMQTLTQTVEQVLRLAPDRIAAFGYAHLPQRVKPQRLIDSSSLPGPIERFELADRLVSLLEAGDYRRIGLDHFARRGDELASRPLHRNFQGYTVDAADALIGLGASAIGKLPSGYVQNAVPAHEYERLIAADGLATARGIALSPDDKARAWAIERLMCDFRLPTRAFAALFGEAARPVLAEAAQLAGRDNDGLITVTDEGLEVTERGRPFVRGLCTAFDRYFARAPGQHSVAV